MKFIHIADVHLGAKPEKNMPWAKEREEHSWQAFSDVITRAKEEQVQLLLDGLRDTYTRLLNVLADAQAFGLVCGDNIEEVGHE